MRPGLLTKRSDPSKRIIGSGIEGQMLTPLNVVPLSPSRRGKPSLQAVVSESRASPAAATVALRAVDHHLRRRTGWRSSVS